MFLWERKREKEDERNIDVRNIHRFPPEHTPIRNGKWSLGMSPDQESDQHPFGAQNYAQQTESHRPGHIFWLFQEYFIKMHSAQEINLLC